MANATTIRAAWDRKHAAYLLQLIDEIAEIAPQLRAHMMAEFNSIDWEHTWYAGGPVDFEDWLIGLRMQVTGNY